MYHRAAGGRPRSDRHEAGMERRHGRDELSPVVPPARANQVLHAGILAGNVAWRSEVVPKVPSSSEAEREARAALTALSLVSARRGIVSI